MSTPQSTPIRQVKLGIVSAKSLPLTNEYKKLLSDQHQRLALKHQQDLDLLDDIRGYVKARLSIEKDYTNALQKLAKHHSNHISKKFALLSQLDHHQAQTGEQQKAQILLQNSNDGDLGANNNNNNNKGSSSSAAAAAAVNQELERQASQNTTVSTTGDNQQQSNNGSSSSKKPSSLYKVWYEHISRLQSTSRNRSDQFEQLIIIVDKLKDIRQHKASIGKKCLESHLRRIQEDLLLSMMDVERAKKLYYEDESQAKKARENEERIKKKRTGLLTKFTDLQAKKERSSAQREATDIQSTQARNDYIMALAAANAHLQHYYQRDLNDFIHLIDDGVLNHCKIFMATLSECDINSLKDALQHAQHWSRLINMTGLQQTNCIFLKCDQSKCLRTKQELAFEACNNDPIQKISLEHNADYALQHEIDKWFTWFKKECRNLGQLMHQLDSCQHAFAEGKKAVEVNGQTIEDLEPKIIELKQQIRKCEAAKLKAQARLRAIKEGGMQIEEWSDVELEIRADMARAQEEQQRALRLKETKEKSMDEASSLMQEPCGQAGDQPSGRTAAPAAAAGTAVQLQISRDSDDDDDVTQPARESMHNLASVSRSTSNLAQKQQVAMTGYSALTDPSLVWQDEYSSAWGDSGALAAGSQQGSVVASNSFHGGRQPQPQQNPSTSVRSPTSPRPTGDGFGVSSGDDPLGANCRQPGPNQDKQKQQIPQANMSIQSSSPLSAIVNGGQHLSQSPYQAGIMSEAYKSDYECDYARTGHHASMRSAASSAEPGNLVQARPTLISSQANEFGGGSGGPADEAAPAFETPPQQQQQQQMDVNKLLNRRVVAQYAFEKNNEDDLAFNENDVLVVIETNPADTNWIKARLESTGEEGFVPSSYVRPIEGEDEGQQQRSEVDAWQSVDQQESMANGSASGGGGGGAQQDEHSQAGTLCRALYDYAPERDTFEDDGLPHLALKQGELMRVIDQGADDGWWLVEKGEGGLRGHVPSMLVEASDPNQDDGDPLDDDDDDEFDDGDVSDREAHDDDDDKSASKGPPPSFEAPVLQVTETVTKQAAAFEGEPLEQRLEFHSHDQEEPQQQKAAKLADSTKKAASASDSLIPTAFIIIEPTPEVESRRFEDSLREGAQAKGADENNNNDDSSNNNIDDDHHDVRGQEARSAQETPTTNDGENNEGFGAAICEGGASEAERQATRQQFVLAGKQPPSSQVSYSVVNEDFVLEKPIRKPYQHSAGSIDNPAGHHHEPTIEEVDDRLEREEIAEGYDCSDDGRLSQEDKHNEPPADLGHERPAPPSVVIDSVEAIPRSPDLSFDENASGQGDEQDASSSYSAGAANGDPDTSQHSDAGSEPAKRAIKHSGYADVSPILRHHAEEFCKQLIEEAILLAPGSRIGPSTSSASVTDDHRNFGDDDEQEEGPDGDYQRNYSFEDST